MFEQNIEGSIMEKCKMQVTSLHNKPLWELEFEKKKERKEYQTRKLGSDSRLEARANCCSCAHLGGGGGRRRELPDCRQTLPWCLVPYGVGEGVTLMLGVRVAGLHATYGAFSNTSNSQ